MYSVKTWVIVMKHNNNETCSVSTAYMPDGTPAPYVLTSEEAVEFLRINTNGTKHPEATLDHYQREGLLCPVTIGKYRKYPLPELIRFISRLSEQKENIS